jgi:hypothetical protein
MGVLPKFSMPSLVPAASSRVNARSTKTPMDAFRRIFAFVRCLFNIVVLFAEKA